MKKRFISAKKSACILTAGMMLLSAGAFTGCGKKNDGSGKNAIVDQQEAMKTLAYKVTEVPIDSKYSFYNVTCKNGLFYTTFNDYEVKDDVYFSNYFINVFDSSGALTLSVPVYAQKDPAEYGGIQGKINVDESGNMTCLFYVGSYNEETGEDNMNYFLKTYDSTGKEVSSTDLEKIITQEDYDNNRYFNDCIVDKSGNLIINMSNCVRVCDASGKILFTTESLGADNNNIWINSIFFTNTGAPAIIYSDYSGEKAKTVVKEVDIAAGGFGKEYEITGYMGGNVYSGSGDYLYYISSETGIMGMRADTMQPEQVLNLLNIGVDSTNMNGFEICDDGSFVTIGRDYSQSKSRVVLSVITPVDSSEVKEKQILSLGCFYLDWNMRSKIADFNKTNENYTIYATSFSETNDTNDWEAALTKFNNELLAGKVPDIILLSSEMPISSYASKGLFTDLYKLMDSDAELTRDKFMPNILEALETDGKLYEITPAFSLSTYAAKTSLVGSERSITLDKAKEILGKMPEGAQLFNYQTTSSGFLQMALVCSDFVDYGNGTCNFDTPEFKAFMEMAKNFPKEIDYEALYNENPNYWQENEVACRENRALFQSTYFYDFNQYKVMTDGYFGEDITLTGFPVSSEGSSGAYIQADTEIAVSEKSAFKEGAWEFIKGIINDSVYEEPVYRWDDETREQVDTGKTQWVSAYYNLPVLTEQMKKLGDQALVPNTYIDENGNEMEQQNSYYIGDQEVNISKPTREEVDMLIDYFGSVTKVYRYDKSIAEIVDEECALFFDGKKSADETASIIQSRASIYMSEQY